MGAPLFAPVGGDAHAMPRRRILEDGKPPPRQQEKPLKNLLHINPFLKRLVVTPDTDLRAEAEPALDPLCNNVHTIMAFYRREERKINRSQRSVEHLSGFFGRPVFLGLILLFVGFGCWAISCRRFGKVTAICWILLRIFGYRASSVWRVC